MRLEILRQARADLENVYLQGLELFGRAQADRYVDGLLDTLDIISEFPQIARLRPELEPPVRAHPHQSHVILYDLTGDAVQVLRIRHRLEDWRGDLGDL